MRYLFIIVCLVSFTSHTQTIIRSAIVPIGISANNNNGIVHQSIGQSYNTTANYSMDIEIRPGIIQPNSISIIPTRLKSQLNISVYPNPSSELVHFKPKVNLENLTLKVYNIRGKEIYQSKIKTLNEYSLNCNSWESGTYFINLISQDGQLYSCRLIKQ